jgi:hydrophobe/amphiphile efflux-3 (HAE3) family protein
VKNIFSGLGTLVQKWYPLVLIISLGLVVLAVLGAGGIKMETGLETMISTESEEYQDYLDFTDYFGNEIIIVMVEAEGEGGGLEQLLNSQNLSALTTLRQALNHPEKYPVVTVAGPDVYLNQVLEQQIEQGKTPSGTELADLSLEARLEMVHDPDTGEIKPNFASVLPDEKYALVSVILQGNLETEALSDMVSTVKDAVEQAGFGSDVNPIVTGSPALMDEINGLMTKTTGLMLLFAVALLFVILALIFKIRGVFPWRWLPLLVIILGIIYTFGLMGLFSIPLTMVSMAVFPVMVGLGIDYGIQFHNRYDEESLRNLKVKHAIRDSITHIGPAVGIALIAGCLGFTALFFSPVPMIQDFGLMLIIGVLASYFVAAFPLMAILCWRDRRNRKRNSASGKKNKVTQKDINPGFVERGLVRLSPWGIKHPFVIISVSLALTIGGLALDSEIEVITDQSAFLSEDIPALQDLLKLEELSGRHASFNLLIKDNGTDKADSAILNPDTLEWMLQIENEIIDRSRAVITEEGEPAVSQASSIAGLIWQANDGQKPQDTGQVKKILAELPQSQIKNLLSQDRSAVNMVINLRYITHDKQEEIKEMLEEIMAESPPPAGISAVLTGGPVIGLKVLDSITGGRTKMTLIGIGFIFTALLLMFRFRVVRALLATLPIVLIIGWSALAMYVLGIEFTPLTATFGALIMGIGVEYTILLMMRYYEERGKDEGPTEAMTTSIAKIGRAISVSAFTTIGGFAALLVARDFPILIDFGIVTMIDVFFAFAASMVVLPTLIVWVDSRIVNGPLSRFL